MNTETGMLLMIFICGIVLVIVLFKSKIEFIINMVLRMMMGTVGVYFVNSILLAQGMECCIGINLVTMLTLGTLGLPGFLLLYGMVFYKML